MKKTIITLGVACLALGLAGCGSKANNSDNHLSSLKSEHASSTYYSSLHQADIDYWNNLSPQEKAQWSQWESAEHWANDPARQRSFVESVNGQ